MDTKKFTHFFNECYDYCIVQKRLVQFVGNQVDAEEIFAEAISKFWVKSAAGAIKHTANLKGLLLVIAKRLWIDRRRNKKEAMQYAIDWGEVDDSFLKIAALYTSTDPLVHKEETVAAEQWQEKRAIAFSTAFAQLDDKCKRLLNARHVYKISAAVVAKKMGFNSARVVTTLTSRCKKKLLRAVYNLL